MLPRKELLAALKALKVKNNATWVNRGPNDPDTAWRLIGEFGVFKELRFERHIKDIYKYREAA